VHLEYGEDGIEFSLNNATSTVSSVPRESGGASNKSV